MGFGPTTDFNAYANEDGVYVDAPKTEEATKEEAKTEEAKAEETKKEEN